MHAHFVEQLRGVPRKGWIDQPFLSDHGLYHIRKVGVDALQMPRARAKSNADSEMGHCSRRS
jgi:hypothetical protein